MTELTPLSQWLLQAKQQVVAVRAGEEIGARALVERVSAWMDCLRPIPGNRWAVYHSDSYEFLAILLALWQLGRTACISSDNRPGTESRLAQSVDGFIGEFQSAISLVDQPTPAGPIREWVVPEPGLAALEIYTSGSTGEPKSISKTMDQLETEVRVIESLWASEPGSVVLATVSHQHLYGMIFSLFWPFSSGRPFETRLCEFPEDIIYRASHYARYSLVSSPSHLGRFDPAYDWKTIAEGCEFIVSSAAPLAREDSLAAGKLLQVRVREIYGSSETGAVAWRSQQDGDSDAMWQALPGVELSVEDEGLRVRSSYLGDMDSYLLPDRVEFDTYGGFRLLGRVDRIVKVEGKRVSLASIEALLLEHDWVRNVRALTLERVRIETAIVMQLNQEGRRQLQSAGRKSLIRIFKTVLGEHLEAVVLPRRWRFVEEMPYNQQGKLPLQNLQALFQMAQAQWPRIIERQLQDGKLTLDCEIPDDLIYFDGHMADRPILPGIVQLHWAQEFGRRWLELEGRFERLEVVKFQQVILPHYRVSISLEFNPQNRKLSFRYESKKGVHSSGRICYSD